MEIQRASAHNNHHQEEHMPHTGSMQQPWGTLPLSEMPTQPRKLLHSSASSVALTGVWQSNEEEDNLDTVVVDESEAQEQLGNGTVYWSSGQESQQREQFRPYPLASLVCPLSSPLHGVGHMPDKERNFPVYTDTIPLSERMQVSTNSERRGVQQQSGQAKRGKPSQRSRRIGNPIFLVLLISLAIGILGIVGCSYVLSAYHVSLTLSFNILHLSA